MTTPRFRLDDVRRRLLAEARLPARVWSLDGRSFSFRAGLDEAPRVGSYVRIDDETGRSFVGQIHDREVATIDFGEFEVDAASLAGMFGEGAGPITKAKLNLPVRAVTGGGALLVRVDGTSVQALADEPGFAEGSLGGASDETVAAVMTAAAGDAALLAIGRLATAPSVPARLRATGFGRHTFLCGQSGSGKTYALGGLLERLLLETELDVVVLDPNSDHIHLAEVAPDADLDDEVRRRYGAATERVLIARGNPTGQQLPMRVRFGDLTIDEQALTLRLDPLRDSEEYHAFTQVADRLAGSPYTLRDVRAACLDTMSPVGQSLARRIDNLGVAAWSVWAEAGEPSLADVPPDWRAMVVDLGSLPNADERMIVALAVLGRIRHRPQRRPLLLVLDEAHHLCAAEPTTELASAACETVVWMAGEGRKYGIYLVVATQRPQKIHRNVVSQCDNLLLMRVNSREDIGEIVRTFSHVPAPLVAEATSFGLGEMLAGGPVAPSPMRLEVGRRITAEGGGDLPTDWARPTRPA